MGIFDNAPHLKEKRNLDPANLDPGLKQVLEEMGVIKDDQMSIWKALFHFSKKIVNSDIDGFKAN